MPRSSHQSLAALFVSAMRRFAQRTALVSPQGDPLSYAKLDQCSNQLANILRDAGIGPGSTVALLLNNSVEFVIADIAIMKLGATKVPLNNLLARPNVSYMLAHSNASAIIIHSSLADLFAVDDLELDIVKMRIAIDDGQGIPEGFACWADLLSGATATPVLLDTVPQSIGMILYTGGTTGAPKGVAHRQDALVHNILSQVILAEIGSDERMLLMTPLPHSAHLLCQAGLLKGATIWLADGFDPSRALATIESKRISWTFMVPTMIYKLLDSSSLSGWDCSSLKTILYGASPITQARLVQALETFGPVFIQIYGQTEAPNFVTILGKEDHLVPELQLSCGQPTLATQVRIRGEQGEVLQAGEVGQVEVRSIYTLSEYFKDPASTANAYSGEWLKTGDVGYLLPSGHLFLVDRAKDMIISGGMNVYSTEVENVIQSFPGIHQVMVIGVPDAHWGEAVTAFVVGRDGPCDSLAIIEHCRLHLAKYKVPKSVVDVKELPLTAYGNLDKQEMRTRDWAREGRSI